MKRVPRHGATDLDQPARAVEEATRARRRGRHPRTGHCQRRDGDLGGRCHHPRSRRRASEAAGARPAHIVAGKSQIHSCSAPTALAASLYRSLSRAKSPALIGSPRSRCSMSARTRAYCAHMATASRGKTRSFDRTMSTPGCRRAAACRRPAAASVTITRPEAAQRGLDPALRPSETGPRWRSLGSRDEARSCAVDRFTTEGRASAGRLTAKERGASCGFAHLSGPPSPRVRPGRDDQKPTPHLTPRDHRAPRGRAARGRLRRGSVSPRALFRFPPSAHPTARTAAVGVPAGGLEGAPHRG